MDSRQQYFIVTADISTEMYSSCTYMFGIFETKDSALEFMKNWKSARKNKYGLNPLAFNFVKMAEIYKIKNETLDESLLRNFVKEFNGDPICLACYFE